MLPPPLPSSPWLVLLVWKAATGTESKGSGSDCARERLRPNENSFSFRILGSPIPEDEDVVVFEDLAVLAILIVEIAGEMKYNTKSTGQRRPRNNAVKCQIKVILLWLSLKHVANNCLS